MDDHMYYWVRDYAECELIPRFEDECRHHNKVTECPSYEEMRDFCEVLNRIGKWAGFNPVKVTDYVPIDKHKSRSEGRDF